MWCVWRGIYFRSAPKLRLERNLEGSRREGIAISIWFYWRTYQDSNLRPSEPQSLWNTTSPQIPTDNHINFSILTKLNYWLLLLLPSIYCQKLRHFCYRNFFAFPTNSKINYDIFATKFRKSNHDLFKINYLNTKLIWILIRRSFILPLIAFLLYALVIHCHPLSEQGVYGHHHRTTSKKGNCI